MNCLDSYEIGVLHGLNPVIAPQRFGPYRRVGWCAQVQRVAHLLKNRFAQHDLEVSVNVFLRRPVVSVLNHLTPVDCCILSVPDTNGTHSLVDCHGPVNTKSPQSHGHQHDRKNEPLPFVNDSEVVEKVDFRSFHQTSAPSVWVVSLVGKNSANPICGRVLVLLGNPLISLLYIDSNMAKN